MIALSAPIGEGRMTETDGPIIYRIPAALVIAGATAAGYSLAHCYESAYLGYFHIPNSLVKVGLNTTLIAIGALISGSALALVNSWLLTATLRLDAASARISTAVTAAVFGILLDLHLNKPPPKIFALKLGGCIVGVILLKVTAVAVDVWRRSRAKKRPTNSAKNDAIQWGALFPLQAPLRWLGWDVFVAAWVLLMAHVAANDAGAAAARHASEFLTAKDPPGYVVIRAYDDSFIAASLDRATRTVGRDVVVLSPQRERLTALTREKLGPLNPPKD